MTTTQPAGRRQASPVPPIHLTIPPARTSPTADGARPHLRLLRAPGVYPAQRDTWLLADVLRAELSTAPRDRRRVLEIGTGTGALSTVAAGFADASVTAVDVCRRALVSAWVNARVRGRRLDLRRGNLTAPVAGERFDLVVSNPPYVPAPDDVLPQQGPARAWDGGRDGRALLDRLCRDAPGLLEPGGCLLLVQSALSGTDRTADALREAGLVVDVAARCRHPFGPVLTERAELLERRGLVAPGDRTEELVVLRGRRPAA